MADQNVFDAAKAHANFHALGNNTSGGGGAASGGGKPIGPSDIYTNNELAQTHLFQTIEAIADNILPFGKTVNPLLAGLDNKDGLLGIFKNDDGWLDKLGAKGGALANMMAKHVQRDFENGKNTQMHEIWAHGGCQVDTSFHADNGSLVGAPPATPGSGGRGGHGEGIA